MATMNYEQCIPDPSILVCITRTFQIWQAQLGLWNPSAASCMFGLYAPFCISVHRRNPAHGNGGHSGR